MSPTTPPPAEITVPYDQFQIYSMLSWVESNNYDPFVCIDTSYPGVSLPPVEMKKPSCIINMASRACGRVQYMDDRIEASVRFSGQDSRVVVPYRSIAFVQFRGTTTALPLPWMRQDGSVEKSESVVKETEPTTQQTATTTPVDTSSESDGVARPSEPKGIKRGHLRVIK